MGQEIVYCSFCQTRLTSADFEKGRAFRADFRISCKACRPLLAPAGPPVAARPPKESRPPRKGSSTRLPPVLHLRESSGGKQIWAFLLAGTGILLVALLAVLSGSRPSRLRPVREEPEPVALRPTEPTPPLPEAPPPPPRKAEAPERVPPPPRPMEPSPQLAVEPPAPAPPPPPPPPEPRPDPEALNRAHEAAQEARKILAGWPKEQPVRVEVFDETGAPRTVEGALLRVERSRMHVRTSRGKEMVELGEVTPGSLASLARNGADLLRTFEKELAPGNDKEQAARRLFHQAEREHRDFSTRADAVGKFDLLLKEHPGTAFVARNRASILDRSESGKEYWFFPGNMAADGAMKPARHPKAGDCLTAAEVTESSAAISFSTLPGTVYRCWVYVGGCCGEALTFQAEGSEMTASRVRNSISVIARHSGHGSARQPSKWGWASVPLPRYSAPGPKTLRLITTQTGFSVAAAVVSAVRTSPPTETEVRDAERPEACEPVPPGLELWLRFDEPAGPSAKDSSGRAHAALLVGEARPQEKALSVDRDGHARVADAPPLRFRADQSFTVAAWVRASERRGGYQGIVTKSRDQKPHYGLWTGHGKWVFGGSLRNIEAGSVDPEWQHVAGVQDGPAGKRTLYLNGVPIGSTDAQAGDGPGELRVGSTAGPTEYFGGMIDDVRLYSRALAPEEVALLHARGR